MPTIKNYFNGKVDLDEALKRAKGRQCAFAFGIGKSGSMLVLDYRNEYTTAKFEKELKKTDYKSKYIVGTALVDGKIIQMKSEFKKNSIKPKDVKDYLAENKLKVTRAVIDGKGSEEDEDQKGGGKKK
ncbi:MAG: hypothetical protein CMJ50_05945 [Planctomycetaceae bacterium]|jgi:hypothetical protein|nr:hypothetical protein [Planctomycetaceae bacterium]